MKKIIIGLVVLLYSVSGYAGTSYKYDYAKTKDGASVKTTRTDVYVSTHDRTLEELQYERARAIEDKAYALKMYDNEIARKDAEITEIDKQIAAIEIL